MKKKALVDEFESDILKNLKSWQSQGQAVWYLTDRYWYQYRVNGKAVVCVRQSLKTHKVDRASTFKSRIRIGRKWLDEAKQASKRTRNFFRFTADL